MVFGLPRRADKVTQCRLRVFHRLQIGWVGGCVPCRQRLRRQSVDHNAKQYGQADRRDHLIEGAGYALEVFERD